MPGWGSSDLGVAASAGGAAPVSERDSAAAAPVREEDDAGMGRRPGAAGLGPVGRCAVFF